MPKATTREMLADCDHDMLYTVVSTLLSKYPELELEINLLIAPKSVNNPVAYYKKQITKAIDTNSWDNFPNKGIAGLNKSIQEFQNLKALKLHSEAFKLATCIIDVIFRCLSTNKNRDEIEAMEAQMLKEIQDLAFKNSAVDKIKTSWLRPKIVQIIKFNSYWDYPYSVYQQDKGDLSKQRSLLAISNKFLNGYDQELIKKMVLEMIFSGKYIDGSNEKIDLMAFYTNLEKRKFVDV